VLVLVLVLVIAIVIVIVIVRHRRGKAANLTFSHRSSVELVAFAFLMKNVPVPQSENSPSDRPIVSVVVPVYNERENLGALEERLPLLLEQIVAGRFEILFVDDGSRDGSGELLDAMSGRDPRCKVIHLSRNFGQQPALQAGLDFAAGQAVILMDADLQDPPELLAQFIAKWKEGYEVVYAIRKRRKEGPLKRLAYSLFYRTLKRVAEIDTPLDAGDFCLMDRRVVETLRALPERNRFLRGLRSWVGFTQAGIEYDREGRNAGESKYTLRKLIGLALSGYLGFSSLPLRLAAWLGMLSASAGFLLTVWVVVSKFTQSTVPRGWASTIAIMLFIGGTQLMMLGILGEYLGRVYDEVRQRPLYVVRSQRGVPLASEAESSRPGSAPSGDEG
jgi:dolichol-phosphate mannosyltransferase